jgi:hypothetical protein
VTDLPERRLTVFLDILGFRDLVQQCPAEPARYLALRGAFSYFGETKARIKANVLRPRDLQFISFSDSIVVSAPLSGFTDQKLHMEWSYLVTELGALVLRLLKEGLLCRGGISIGWLYHRNNVLFGQGLIAAYDLETTHARYPRILVSGEVAKRFGEELLIRDSDGFYLLNIFNFAENHTHVLELGRALQGVLNGEAERETKRPGILAKLIWLANLYNRNASQDVFQISIRGQTT